MTPLRSPEAYLARIGLAGGRELSLAEIHRAHATSIPFENFDPYAGRSVALDAAHLEDKLVARRRGGYCFEHNLLLASALESLGGRTVEPMLARVRMGPEGTPRALNHLLLRVTDRDGSSWLADVGFGGGGLLDPLPFGAGAQSEQSGWTYRLSTDGPELVLQTLQDGAWSDMYGFEPEAVPLVDVEVSNWYTATHPESPFVTGIMIGRRLPERCLSLFAYEETVFVERPVGGASDLRQVTRAEVPALLADRFGIEGVTLSDGRFGLGRASA
jgi:N-hydroxyarylamine O-acetyltransferase